MDKLDFDPIGIKQHGLIYTTLSHIRDISSLYLLHQLHPKKIVVNNKVKIEMQRLQNIVDWKIYFNIFSLQNYGHILLCSLNTQSFSFHLDNIVSNYGLMHIDFLCL